MAASKLECIRLTLDDGFQLGEFRRVLEGETSDSGRGMELVIFAGDAFFEIRSG
jgi:hypothetical protein